MPPPRPWPNTVGASGQRRATMTSSPPSSVRCDRSGSGAQTDHLCCERRHRPTERAWTCWLVSRAGLKEQLVSVTPQSRLPSGDAVQYARIRVWLDFFCQLFGCVLSWNASIRVFWRRAHPLRSVGAACARQGQGKISFASTFIPRVSTTSTRYIATQHHQTK